MKPFAFGQALLISDEKIMILGGKSNLVTHNRVYVYDLEKDKLKPFKHQLIDSDYFTRTGSQYTKHFD